MAKEKKPAAPKADEFDKLLSSVATKFGENSLFNGADAAHQDYRIQFDAPRLTWAYGGSFKLNAIHRFNGKESGGKTTLCTYIAGQCQRRKFEAEGNYNNAHVVIIDNERTFDVIRAKDLGLILEDPETGKPLVHVLRNLYVEDQCAAWEQIVVSGRICCTIFDSDAASINKAEFDNEIGKPNFGSSAKAVGTVIKRMNYYVDTYKTPLLWISQERAAIEMMAHLPSLTGGYAINFYPSSRFRVTPKEQITRSGEIIGITMKIKNYKNKTGIPFRECLLDVYFRDGEDFKSGIDGEGQYIDMLVELGEITQHGAWYYYHEGKEDMQRFQGMAGTRAWFKEHPDEFAKAKKVVNDLMTQHSALDKDTLETDEMEDVKQDEVAAVEKRQENTSILAEQALQEETEPEE